MAQDYYVTPTRPSGKFSRKTLLMGGGLLVAIVIAFVLLSSGGGGSSKQMQHLSLRMFNLQQYLVSPIATQNLKDENLIQTVTELKLALTSSRNDLAPLMVSAGLPVELDKDIVASEADTTSATALNEGLLNNKFDRTFTEILGQKITSLRALVAETFGLVSNTKFRQELITLDTTLKKNKSELDSLNL